MTAADVFKKLILEKYRESPVDRYPQEGPLADHLLAGLKAAGYAVVELPKPDSTRYEGDEHEPEDRLAWATGSQFAVSVWKYPEVQVAFSDEPFEPITIGDARRFARALLAAADAAEATNA
jgi:hypothetical protein